MTGLRMHLANEREAINLEQDDKTPKRSTSPVSKLHTLSLSLSLSLSIYIYIYIYIYIIYIYIYIWAMFL